MFFLQISYFVLMVTLGGVFSICTAFARDLVTLFVLTGLSTVCLGSFATLSFSLFVYTMGPIKSRPFTMLLHCIVGLGFLVGSLFVRPFLPQRENDEEGKSFQVFY